MIWGEASEPKNYNNKCQSFGSYVFLVFIKARSLRSLTCSWATLGSSVGPFKTEEAATRSDFLADWYLASSDAAMVGAATDRSAACAERSEVHFFMEQGGGERAKTLRIMLV